MSIQLKDTAKNKRDIEKLKKPVQDKVIKESLPDIPDAAKVIMDMKNEIKKLQKAVSGLQKTQGKLWKDKVERDLKRA